MVQHHDWKTLRQLHLAFFACILLATVTRSNGNLVILGQTPFRAYTSRATPPDSTLYQFFAINSQNGSSEGITYSIRSEQDVSGLFFLHSTTGELINLDYLEQSQYDLVVEVRLSEQASVTADLSILVVPESDTTPRFERSRYEVEASESLPVDSLLTVVRAFSLDFQSTSHQYSIVGGNTGNEFSVNSNTGVLRVERALDRERTSSYVLTVRYLDDAAAIDATVEITILDVNDNPPQFIQPFYNVTIEETIPIGSLVLTVSASDPDANGNGRVVYDFEIVAGNVNKTFTVDQLTGELHTIAALDYERQSQYPFSVTAFDEGNPRRSAVAIVEVNLINIDDECPRFGSTDFVRELPYDPDNGLIPVDGMEVLTVTASDPDRLSDVSYAIISGNEAGFFAINPTRGILTLNLEDEVNSDPRGQYSLNISASDQSCVNMSFVCVEVGIGSINNHSPQFQTECTAELLEEPSMPTEVITLEATDEDIGTNGEVTYQLLTHTDLFSINSLGIVSTTASEEMYDRETQAVFQVGVTATDGGGRQDYCLLTITLLDRNDNSPLFLSEQYSTSYSTSSPVGMLVITVHADDRDLGENGLVQYSLSYLPELPFTIDPLTGDIVTNSTLSQIVYSFNVTATDMGDTPLLSSSVVVNVMITNGNAFPMFNQTQYNASICENAPIGTVVTTVLANSSPNEPIIYEVVEGIGYRSNEDGIFQVAAATGVITVHPQQTSVDYERLLPSTSFLFLVKAVNSAGSSLANVRVEVGDQNDNPPQFMVSEISVSLPENEPPGTFLTQLQAVDLDTGSFGEIEYRMISGFVSSYYNVSPNGTITTLVEFDAEDVPSGASSFFAEAYNPNIPADDNDCSSQSPQHSDQVLVRVTITDVNDNPPFFMQSMYSVTVPENHPILSRVLLLSATDTDSSDAGKLTYTILDGNGTFEIDSIGSINLAQRLDFETTPMYVLRVQVSDGLRTNTTIVNVHLNDTDDEAPVFTAETYYGQVVENADEGTHVLMIKATDVDSNEIQYELRGLAIGRFAVDNNGNITVAGPIDREEFTGGQIVFLAFAGQGSLAVANIVVTISDVNDYMPRFSQSFVGQVPENVAPGNEGLFVVEVQAVDLDEGQNGTVTYSLLSGEEDGFQIDAQTGVITAQREFDREATPAFTLVIRATDNGIPEQLFSTAEVTVEVGDDNDNKPFFPYPYMFARVVENSPVGTHVVTIPASDPDIGSNAAVTFSLISMNPSEIKFHLNSSTGAITVAGSLDYEIPQHRLYTLTLAVSDALFEADSTGLLEIQLLDQNDNQPMILDIHFPLGSNNIQETIPKNTEIVQINAVDGDSGPNGELVYSIVDGDPNGDFGISDVGVISNVRYLDRETTPSYSLSIRISDGGEQPEAITTDVSLSIMDVNDEVPVFSMDPYQTSVPENMGPVPNILRVSASDPDSGSGGNVTIYRIVAGNEEGRFGLISNTGVLETLVRFDRETQDSYELTVEAVDGGVNSQTGTGTIIVAITDVNDNPSSDDGHLEITIYALDGHIQAGDLAPVHFSDPDVSDVFEGCAEFLNPTGGIFTVNPACILRLSQDNPLMGSYSVSVVGNDSIHNEVSATVDIMVEHLPSTLVPSENILTISLNSRATDIDSNFVASFPTNLANALGTEEELITLISIQEGYHDAANTIDITFSARNREGSFLDPTAMLQDLYTQRASLDSSLSLYALPTDPCTSEPCINQAACKAMRMVGETQLAIRSSEFVLFAPQVEMSYVCECVPGTSGENCETNFDDCYSNPCLHDSECTDTVQGFMCNCPEGSSGSDCSFNPDECVSSPCQNGACRNGLGTHICDCQPGFYGSECQYHYFRESSFCSPTPCQNGGECSAGRDSFTCLCPQNYSGPLCEEEVLIQGGCIGNPCYNGSTCMGTPEGPVCTCSVGFTGPNCRWPLNNCELEPCRNGGTCEVGLYGSYQCTCLPLYTGENCTELIPPCESSPCQNGGRCFDLDDGSYTCECTREYYGTTCETPILPEDLCESSPCHPDSNCTSNGEEFTCTCPSNVSGLNCSIPSPPSSPCDSNPCLFGSTCTATSGGYTCVCSTGFTGVSCEINLNDCTSNPCTNGGTCTDGIGSFVCSCPEFITGRLCEVYCPEGYTGDFCETVPEFCSDGACLNGGTCTEEAAGFSCECAIGHTGQRCEVANNCSISECRNGGTCSDFPSGGFECECGSDFSGDNCELLVASFSGSQTTSSYRTFDSLDIRGQGTITLQFATTDSTGLLLYNTQFQEGESRDFLAVEVVGGYLTVSVSHGADSLGVAVMSSTVRVSDGLWHRLTVDSTGREVRVLLDYCRELEEGLLDFADCTATAATQGNQSFLDLGLPLWVGGVPFSPAPAHSLMSQGITGCVGEVAVNGRLIDLEGFLYEERSQRGCPQLEDACAANPCHGGGACVPVWTDFRCICPPLVAGDTCDLVAESLTFSGDNYAQYSLVLEGGGQSRRQEVGVVRSSFEEEVSLRFQTEEERGLLFHMAGESDVASLEVDSGEVAYRVNLGGLEEVVRASGIAVNSSEWHTVRVLRRGLQVTLTVDNTTVEHSLSGTALTLDVSPNEIYAGGRTANGEVIGGFRGCLQDIRLDQFALPTSGSNRFASVSFGGVSDVMPGCTIGACSPNPCGSGACVEAEGGGGYVCNCPDGSQLDMRCPEPVQDDSSPLVAIVAGSVVGGVALLAVAILVFAGLLYCWRRRRHKYVVDTVEEKANEMDVFGPSQCLVISNDPGGGEQDTPVDWDHRDKPHIRVSPASSHGTLQKHDLALELPRANSPTIQSFIEQQVEAANKELQESYSLDAMREFGEEGVGTGVSELSSICSDLDSEEYTMERLRNAGPQFVRIAEMLEDILAEEENIDSGSEATHTTHDQ